MMCWDGIDELYLFVLVAVGAALTDFCLFLGSTRAVQAGDVSFFLGLGLHLLFCRLVFQLGALEGDASHHGLRDFVFACFTCGGHCRGLCEKGQSVEMDPEKVIFVRPRKKFRKRKAGKPSF